MTTMEGSEYSGRRRITPVLGTALALAGCALTASGQVATPQPFPQRVPGDFNGNGTADLAIGVPYQNVGSATDAGEVHIMYTAPCCGVMSTSNIVLRPGVYGISGSPATYERFGAALAIGNFDGDDYHDLAIGVPGRAVSGRSYAGAVVIVYGSASGLSGGRTATFTQDTSGIADAAESNDEFGSALAAGDFNHDGRDDLLIGVPREDIDGYSNAGVVHVLYGTSTGLSATNSQLWYQNENLDGSADDDDRFGQALAAGDFDNDGYDDAAIGVPGDLSNSAGAVNILYGSSARLTSDGNHRLYRDIAGMEEDSDAGDEFGSALAAGDFNGDGADDLAIGAYGDTLPNPDPGSGSGLADYWFEYAGSVSVVYGVENVGLSVTDAAGNATDEFWSQNSTGINDCAAEPADWFGYALTVGDFDSDGYDDLAIGVPGEAIGSVAAAGMVNVIYGRGDGLHYSGSQNWHQDTTNVAGAAQADDIFGWALAAADFDGDGHDDLVAGVPQEDVNGVSYAGAINVIYGMDGSTGGLDADGNACWHRADSGMGSLQSGAQFGRVLAARR